MEKVKKESEALWAQIMENLRTHGQADGYAIDFISGLRLVEDTGTRLIIEYPEGLMLAWLELNYSEYIETAACNVLQAPRELEFVEAGSLKAVNEYARCVFGKHLHIITRQTEHFYLFCSCCCIAIRNIYRCVCFETLGEIATSCSTKFCTRYFLCLCG